VTGEAVPRPGLLAMTGAVARPGFLPRPGAVPRRVAGQTPGPAHTPPASPPVARPGAVARPAAGMPGALARPAARARAGVGVRRPYHLAVAIGATAGVYALSLATVTALQAGTNAGVAAARQPTVDAIATMRADHDALEAAVARAEASYTLAADTYAAIAAGISEHEAVLGRLAGLTDEIEGTAASLPTRIALPTVTRTTVTRTTVTRVAVRPASNATSGASGGG